MKDSLIIQTVLFILLGTSTIAAINSTNSPPSPSKIASTPLNTGVSNQPKRLKITLSINNPSDLKVREGQRVTKGQILSDRDTERKRLTGEKQAILLSIAKIEQTQLVGVKPAFPILSLPSANYAEEEAGVSMAELKFQQASRNLNEALSIDPFITARAQMERAKSELQQAVQAADLQQSKVDKIATIKTLPPEVLSHESEVLKKKLLEVDKFQSEYDFRVAEYKQVEEKRRENIANLQNAVLTSKGELELSQAKLRSAKGKRQQQEYEHQITVARRQEEQNQSEIAASNQKLEKEFKLSQLQAQLSNIEEKLNSISQVKSPYAGLIKRIKTQKQSDNTITVVVTLQPDSSVTIELDQSTTTDNNG
jgi:biotin carboxyl carrier protein